MTYKISTVALPEKKRRAPVEGKKPKYPLADLRPGTDDCILVAGNNPHVTKNRISSTIAHYRKNGGEGRFKIREVPNAELPVDVIPEDGVVHVGVWRVE